MFFTEIVCFLIFFIAGIPENRTSQMRNGVCIPARRPITTLTRQMAPVVWQGLEGLEPRPARFGMTS